MLVYRTGLYLCKFRRKFQHIFYDRGKLLLHIKENRYTPTVTQIMINSLVEAPLECPLERKKFILHTSSITNRFKRFRKLWVDHILNLSGITFFLCFLS
jgi:hypothetical protein